MLAESKPGHGGRIDGSCVVDLRMANALRSAALIGHEAKTHQAEKTFTWYRDHIQTFVSAIPKTLTVSELKQYHVTRVIDAHADWSNSTESGFARSVQRRMRWAEGQGLIERTQCQRSKSQALKAASSSLPRRNSTTCYRSFPTRNSVTC